ncbi:helix-turn-helix transcriptional regulator [Pacificimonas sp. WHA3]|uniref:Helix-turn-helix transcriptional regulator n=1 Tax=Pacificimonas pallii TaxID=2827236 RepID=A0ABS6SDQ4_9SPHN|nr:helix-turn-helix transcriptional regulator [Pacificimonas pallii]MBV7256480.1 helix-turn-helix transcriptional regulator [Pacificimonas pallii]
MGPIAERIRLELARHRKSRQWLADRARISLSTLEKVLSGRRRFTFATLVRIEDALGVSLRGRGEDPAAAAAGQAPDHLGAYSRAAVGWLEARYVMLRPSAGEKGAVYAHGLTIGWDEDRGHLTFREWDRVDAEFSQAGNVGVSALSGHIYLVTNELGQYRLVILGRPARGGSLYGVLTTLQVGKGAALMPVTMPLALLRLGEGEGEPVLGRVSAGQARFDDYRRELDRVLTEDYARMLT